MKARCITFALLLYACSSLAALDFGATISLQDSITDQYNTFYFSVNPWFSLGLNEKFQVYASGSVALKHQDGDLLKPGVWFDFTRTEAVIRPIQGLSIAIGRTPFSDTLNLAASGLYDGVLGSLDLGVGRLGVGFFYTGLLYKKTAEIVMSAEDMADYVAPWDWDDFGKSYFASRRLLGGLHWDMPIIRSVQDSLSFDLLLNFDVNGDHKNTLNSQYLEAGYFLQPIPYFGMQLGGIFEMIEDEFAEKDLQVALGWATEFFFYFPLVFPNRLALGFRGFTGAVNDTLVAFNPVKGQALGQVFEYYDSLAAISQSYDARIINSLACSAAFRYFLRTDDTAYGGTDADARALGGEIYASLYWSPLDDLAASVGGGVFIPAMGNVYDSGTDPSWKVSFGLTLSF